jgi:hypothetical protein
MVLYKTYITRTSTDEPVLISWQGSQTEASKARSAAKKEGHKAASQTVNIPTAKGPLIEWLNEQENALA